MNVGTSFHSIWNRSLRKFGLSRRNAGLSLVEILVAVTIFSLLIIPVITMFNQTSRAGMRTKEQMMAANLAQEKIEEYRSIGFAKLQKKLDALRENGLIYYDKSEAPVPGFQEFSRQTIVSYFPEMNPPATNAMAFKRIKVTVEVTWKPGRMDLDKSYKLFTILADKTPYHGVQPPF